MDVLIVGGDAALKEGLLQFVRAGGLRADAADDAEGAHDIAADDPPIACVVHVSVARRAEMVRRIPLRPGGAVILFRDDPDAGASADQAFGRTVVAELSLPLERVRLHALLHRIVERARVTGRDRRAPDPPLSP